MRLGVCPLALVAAEELGQGSEDIGSLRHTATWNKCGWAPVVQPRTLAAAQTWRSNAQQQLAARRERNEEVAESSSSYQHLIHILVMVSQ
jgi:hypothetical protein